MISLRQQAISGFRWRALSSGTNAGLDLLRMVVLAHLLIPEDFGLMGMVMVVTGLANIQADLGTSAALIQRQKSTPEEQSSLYWLNLILGAVQFLVLAVASPLIALFFDEPRITPLIQVAALAGVINAFGAQFAVLMHKELRFMTLSAVETVGALAAMALSIAGAVLGLGVWALVLGQIGSCAVTTLLVMAIGMRTWRPSLCFNVKALTSYLHFGLYHTGDRILGYLSKNIDNLMVGRWLGAGALGAYTMAYRLLNTPLDRLQQLVASVTFPAFSKRQSDPAALNRGYLETAKIVALIFWPTLAGLALLTPSAVPLLLGDKWQEASPLFRVVALTILARALMIPAGSALLAKGRADVGCKWNLWATPFKALVFWVVLDAGAGILAFSVGYALFSLVASLCFLHVARRVMGFDLKALLAAWRVPAACAVLTTVVAALALALGRALGLGQITTLVLAAAAGGAAYLAVMLTVEKRYLKELLGILGAWGRQPPGVPA